MSHMNRRALLRTFLLAVPAVALAGCANFGSALATTISDAKLIANGLAAVLPGFAGTPIYTEIQGYVAQAIAAAQALEGAVSAAVAMPSVKNIEAALNGVVQAAAALPLPPPYSTYLSAAAALLPVLEAGIGLMVPAASPVGHVGAGVSVGAARATLGGLPDAVR